MKNELNAISYRFSVRATIKDCPYTTWRFVGQPQGIAPTLMALRFHLGLLSRSARYYVSYSTPTGLRAN